MSLRSSSEWGTRPGSRGFTLLEILVAVSIVAIVLASVYGVFASISRATERVEADSEIYQRVRVIYDRLGREIRGVAPIGGPDQAGVFRAGVDADGQPFLEITTSAAVHAGERQTGVVLVRYTLAPDRDDRSRKALYRSEQSALVDERSVQESGAMRLAAGVEEMTWRFLSGERWATELEAGRDGLPLLAELTLTMRDGRGNLVPFRSAFELPDIRWR